MQSDPGMQLLASVQASAHGPLVSAGITHRGLVRSNNEDCFCTAAQLGLFIVADGMGGTARGHIASGIAVDCVREVVQEFGTIEGVALSPSAALRLMVSAIEQANVKVHRAAGGAPTREGMGTTIAALWILGSQAVIAHVGDSRVYRFRRGQLELKTEDHSLFNDYVRAGKADPNRPERFKYHHVVTRVLGSRANVEVDACLIDVLPGDTFLLSSDGLHVVVRQPRIAGVLMSHSALGRAARRLIELANDRGGPDNITAVLVRVEGSKSSA